MSFTASHSLRRWDMYLRIPSDSLHEGSHECVYQVLCKRALSLRCTGDAKSSIQVAQKTMASTVSPGIRLRSTCSFVLFLLIWSSWNLHSSPLLLSFCLWLWFGSTEDGRRPYESNEIIYKHICILETSFWPLTFFFKQEAYPESHSLFGSER